jgi:hypothetical protein
MKTSNSSVSFYSPKFLLKISFLIIFYFMLSSQGCIPDAPASDGGFTGRWDLTVKDVDREYPAWLEVTMEGDGYTGRYVSGKEGSARPIPNIKISNDTLWYSLPPQYEKQEVDLKFTIWKNNDGIEGYTFNTAGSQIPLLGVPAPDLPYREITEWGEPVNLLRDNDLQNWRLRFPDKNSGWSFKDGILINTPPSEDLISEEIFNDFKLTAEYRTTENSNSGIYLRGRYELQVMNNPKELTPTSVGGVYGFIQPAMKAAKEPGEWNKFDVTFIGRYITIVLNGDTTAYMQEIPGITGGALDSKEGEEGPIMLQGDHREIEYRNIVVIPAK